MPRPSRNYYEKPGIVEWILVAALVATVVITGATALGGFISDLVEPLTIPSETTGN